MPEISLKSARNQDFSGYSGPNFGLVVTIPCQSAPPTIIILLLYGLLRLLYIYLPFSSKITNSGPKLARNLGFGLPKVADRYICGNVPCHSVPRTILILLIYGLSGYWAFICHFLVKDTNFSPKLAQT